MQLHRFSFGLYTINLSNVRFPVRHLDYIALEVSLVVAYLFFDLDPALSLAHHRSTSFLHWYVSNLPPLTSLALRFDKLLAFFFLIYASETVSVTIKKKHAHSTIHFVEEKKSIFVDSDSSYSSLSKTWERVQTFCTIPRLWSTKCTYTKLRKKKTFFCTELFFRDIQQERPYGPKAA